MGVLTPRGLRLGLGPRKCRFTISKLDPQSDRLEPGMPAGNTHAFSWRLAGVLMAPQPPWSPFQLPGVDPGPLVQGLEGGDRDRGANLASTNSGNFMRFTMNFEEEGTATHP